MTKEKQLSVLIKVCNLKLYKKNILNFYSLELGLKAVILYEESVNAHFCKFNIFINVINKKKPKLYINYF